MQTLFINSDKYTKTILQGTVLGGRKPGRQRMALKDNIEDSTKMKFTESQIAAQNRDLWREISIRSAKDASTT